MKKDETPKKERYVVWARMAPYAARYLVDNYGVRAEGWKNLVNVSSDAAIMAFLTPRLVKHSHAYDRRKGDAPPGKSYRTARVAIEISARRFARSGWALSLTDESALATLIETRCRGMLLTFLTAHYMISGDAAASIRAFYRQFHQTEDTWPYDSIRKIWNRGTPATHKRTINGVLERRVQEIVLTTLSENGTISAKGKRLYEND